MLLTSVRIKSCATDSKIARLRFGHGFHGLKRTTGEAGRYCMEIRAETAADGAYIWDIHASAFPTTAEADLVNKLRRDGDVVYSLVAVSAEKILGHALYSKMQSPDGFLGLAPVAVFTSHRRQGIADALIKRGLELAKADGWSGVFVLGGDYYKRFGFDPELAAGFSSPYAGPHFMALPLQSEGLKIPSGLAEYPRAFLELA
jgi:putative acetyltransferase